MSDFAVLVAVAVLVGLFVLVELASAVLPLVIVMTLVPAAERRDLATLIAAADSSRKLRLWPALRLAVQARQGHHNAASNRPPGATNHRPPGAASNRPPNTTSDTPLSVPGMRQAQR